MAYCGQCGTKNPDGAKFCSNCGAPLEAPATAAPAEELRRQEPTERVNPFINRIKKDRGNTPASAGAEEKPQGETIRADIPRREAIPPRRESAPPRRDSVSLRREPVERPKKKSSQGGSLKKLLPWIGGIVVVLGLLLWGIGSCLGNPDGGGDNEDENDKQDVSTFEKIMSPESVDSLMKAKGFPQTTEDVAPLGGKYIVSADGYNIDVTLEPAQNGKIVGKVKMSANGYKAVRDGVYCYCGNSMYAIYKYEDHIERNKVHGYFYAFPDRKSIMMIDGKQYTLKRQDPPPTIKGKGDGLLSRDYRKCMDEAMATAMAKKEGFPETFEDNTAPFGSYTFKAVKGSMSHTGEIKLEPYDGDNKMIVAKMTMISDGKEAAKGYVGYCGFSIYAMYMESIRDYKDEEDYVQEKDIELNKTTHDFFFANADGSISLYDKGKEVMRIKAGEVTTINID